MPGNDAWTTGGQAAMPVEPKPNTRNKARHRQESAEMKKTKPENVTRRAFLKTGAVVGSGAALATLLPGSAAADNDESTTPCDGKQKGYRLSQHVADYYKAAKV